MSNVIPFGPKIVVVYGPAGCGKTRNADRLARHFKCQKIVDDSIEQHSEAGFRQLVERKATLVLCQHPAGLPDWMRQKATFHHFDTVPLQ